MLLQVNNHQVNRGLAMQPVLKVHRVINIEGNTQDEQVRNISLYIFSFYKDAPPNDRLSSQQIDSESILYTFSCDKQVHSFITKIPLHFTA